jgi:hypothetical protein
MATITDIVGAITITGPGAAIQVVTFKLNCQQVKNLQKQAHQASIDRETTVTVSDLIRESITKSYNL